MTGVLVGDIVMFACVLVGASGLVVGDETGMMVGDTGTLGEREGTSEGASDDMLVGLFVGLLVVSMVGAIVCAMISVELSCSGTASTIFFADELSDLLFLV